MLERALWVLLLSGLLQFPVAPWDHPGIEAPSDPREALLLAARLNGLDPAEVLRLAAAAPPAAAGLPAAHARFLNTLDPTLPSWDTALPLDLAASLTRVLDAVMHSIELQREATRTLDHDAWQTLARAYLGSRSAGDRAILDDAWQKTGGLPAGLDRTRIAAAAYTLLDHGLIEAENLRRAARALDGTTLHDELFGPPEAPLCIRDPTALIALCGLHDDTIQGDHILRIDLGGNDAHNGNNAGSGLSVLWPGPYEIPAALLIDLDGDDTYRGAGQTQGTGSSTPGVLLDLGGSDRFTATGTGFVFAQGAGNLGGVGILYNAAGSNTYSASRQAWDTQGFGILGGIGILLDTGYGTSHSGGTMAQGIGDFQAVGLLIGTYGPDVYDAARWSQGFADGGGIGILWDPAGFDHYACTLTRCQAAAVGGSALLIDTAGDDTYIAQDEAQGWATTGPAWAPIQTLLDLISQRLPGGALLLDIGGNDIHTGSDGCTGCVWTGGSGGVGVNL